MTEQEIRLLLQAKLADSPSGQGAAFVSELFIACFARRADLVMANGKLAAFEIKSERDSLERLEGQLDTYLRLFEQVTVVCAKRHVQGVKALVKDGVGIWQLTEKGTFKVVRKGTSLPKKSRPSWLSFLPVAELRTLMVEHGLVQAGTRDVLERRADQIAVSAIRAHVLAYFKTRRESAIARRQSMRLPRLRTDARLPLPFPAVADSAHQIKAIPRSLD
ncbi:hypothetical protein B2J88_11915 [Rhodococcus sp. SRB_17]|uniref:sce7726 family protein n=1 Tax=Acidovorax sp. SRB_24 TaxID=1962700 RepID=UPI00145E8AC9|nr:sce7726 family protein [Acidovorax sp. SRB_24]NMM85066.1 hypothetical protein [Rhodococcus sp. SRB_17]